MPTAWIASYGSGKPVIAFMTDIDLGIYTAKTTLYQGGTKGERDVYDCSGKNWDPEACSSGSSSQAYGAEI